MKLLGSSYLRCDVNGVVAACSDSVGYVVQHRADNDHINPSQHNLHYHYMLPQHWLHHNVDKKNPITSYTGTPTP